MEKLLTNYSISEIIIILVTVALAIKSLITFFEWVIERIQKVFNKEFAIRNDKKQFENKLKEHQEMMENLQDNQTELNDIVAKLAKKIDLLIESDKDDIKSWLTKEHHYFCYQQKWIDDYSLDCCERRYKHYSDEGGNSFIEGFMKELRKLPKQPPELDK